MSECGICMEEISPNTLFKTNCHHSFHNKCITQWLLPKSSCPICRQQLTKGIEENESDSESDEVDNGVVLMYVWEEKIKPANADNVMNQIEAQIQQYEEDHDHIIEYTLESNIRIKEKKTSKILYYNINKIKESFFVVDVYDAEIKINYKDKFYRSKSKFKFKKNNYLNRSTKCKVLSF
jgi:hypothetical protein